MSGEDWPQILGPPILMGIGAVIGVVIKSRIEELRAVQTQLREEPRKSSTQILDPFIRLFASLKKGDSAQQQVVKQGPTTVPAGTPQARGASPADDEQRARVPSA